jgi:hypothetical protein
VDEPTEPPPAAGSGLPQPLVAINTALSPLQTAWGDYTVHTTGCLVCRDVDAGPCPTAEQLWRAYQTVGDEACDRIADIGR